MNAAKVEENMRVPRFVGHGKIEFGHKPVPRPGPGQLLLQVHANAVCGSERRQFADGTTITPGHEAAGTVAAAGPGTHTTVGTPGVVYLMLFCGSCRSCRAGFTNQCLNKQGDMGFNRDGGYGPYELVPEEVFFPVDADAADATLLLDIMGTGGHAIERCRMVRPDIESLLVMGAGPIGLAILAMAKIILGQALPVIVADVVPYRLKLAEQLGGLPVNVATGSLEDGLKRHGHFPVDVAVDTTGKGAARQGALNALAQRGALICVGHGEGLNLQISSDIIAPERSIVGSEYFRYNELSANLPRFREHRSYLKQIITHHFGVAELQHAFEVFFGGETGKVVIEQ
jgi:threonine dehydrogenase-like Zn-dependent dehydrogenase